MPPRVGAGAGPPCAGQQKRWSAQALDQRREGHDPGLLRVCSARHLAILWQNRHDRVMTHRFRSLTLVRIAAAIAVLTTVGMDAGGQESGVRSQPAVDPRPPIRDARLPSALSGQVLVADAAKRVASEPAI